MTQIILSIVFSVFLLSCSSHPVLPEAKDIQVRREDAKANCKSLGAIEGRSTSSKGNAEEALEDLKKDAVRKGANYVKIETMGAQGTAIRGLAYFCP